MANDLQQSQTLIAKIDRNRFAILLASLLLMFMYAPTVEILKLNAFVARLTLTAVFIVLVLASVYALIPDRRPRTFLVSLLIPVLFFEALTVWYTAKPALLLEYTFVTLFIGYVIYLILRTIFESRQVTVNIICASLCAYLLMGMMWATVYSIVSVLDEHSFNYVAINMKSQDAPLRFGTRTTVTAFYYSFVTMTTLGYGDLTPATAAARSLSALQAVTGQLYLAVLVARLVGLQIIHSRDTHD